MATSMLSSKRIGAIIAIERQIGLRNYIEGGIPLDAVMTYDLLLSIFQTTSPLHDGAVIVQGDRVAAAACFLPLTVNPRLSKELGSRHRAALGLTEENDSVAIVVSEETGNISLVADGQIERGLDADTLRVRLRSLIMQRPGRTRPGTGGVRVKAIWPFRHLGLKVLSLGTAVLLWMVIAGDQTVERGLRVPLELQQFPAGLELQAEPPALVDVRVRGSSDTLSRVGPGDIVAVLDLQGGAAGAPAVPAHARTGADAVRRGGRAGRALDARLRVRADRRETAADFTVRRRRSGARATSSGTTTADPATVEITGPESAVKLATEAVTEPVSIAGAVGDVAEDVTVGLLDPALRVKGARTATVKVQVRLGPRERTVQEPAGASSRPSAKSHGAGDAVATSTSCVRGSREGLARLDSDEVVPFVDLKGLGAGGVRADRSRRLRWPTPTSRASRPRPSTSASPLQRNRCRLFGTDGVRGTAGQYPLDAATVRRLGAALVRALPHGTESPRLLDRPRYA